MENERMVIIPESRFVALYEAERQVDRCDKCGALVQHRELIEKMKKMVDESTLFIQQIHDWLYKDESHGRLLIASEIRKWQDEFNQSHGLFERKGVIE